MRKIEENPKSPCFYKEIWDFLFYGNLSEFMGFWRKCGNKMVSNSGVSKEAENGEIA